jgi:hypothetical protein
VFNSRLQNLETTIPLHEKRIADLEEKFKAPVPALAPIPPAAQTMPAAGVATSGEDTQRLAALEKEVADLKASPQTSVGTPVQTYEAIHLLSAFHHFSEKVVSGRPFAEEITTLAELMGKSEATDKAFAALAPYAQNGVPTFAQLLAEFDQSVDQFNTFESTPPAGATMWQRFVFNLEHLVHIRKVDEAQKGNTPDAIVGRAQARLESEDIQAAVAEIKTLPDNLRAAFVAWTDDAKMAATAPAIVDTLEEKVMQKAFHTEAPPAPAKQ